MKRSPVTTKTVGLNVKQKPFIGSPSTIMRRIFLSKRYKICFLNLHLQKQQISGGEGEIYFLCLDVPRRQMAPTGGRWALETGAYL